MKKILSALVLILAIPLLAGAASKKGESPFLGNTDDFKKADWHKDLTYYKNPSKKAVQYESIIFDPVLIFQSESSLYTQLTPDQIQSLGQYFKGMLENAFRDQVKVVSDPGPGVLRARFAIRGLKRGNYTMDKRKPQKIKPDSQLAAATLEMETIDSLTGERIVAMVQNVGSEQVEKAEKEEILSTVESIFEDWVEDLKQLYVKEKTVSTIPK